MEPTRVPAAASSLGLPPEMIMRILDYTDDATFCAARLAHSSFVMHDREAIHLTRRLPRWLRTDPHALCSVNHVEAILALVAAGVPLGREHMSTAIAHHAFGVVMALPASACERGRIPLAATDAAASIGDLDALGQLYDSHRAVWSASAMDLAAANGHLAAVKFLYERGILGTTTAIDDAVLNGHADVVEFLLAHHHKPAADPRPGGVIVPTPAQQAYGRQGCTYDAMCNAALNGRLDIVRMLDINGARCRKDAMDCAAAGGHLDIVIYLDENRAEGCTVDAMDDAASRGHMDVVAYLDTHRREGCTTKAMDGAADAGHLDIVMYLHNNRREGCTTWAMDGAAGEGHLDVVKFLHENRREGCTADAIDMAAAAGFMDVVVYLCEHVGADCTPRAMDRAAEAGHDAIVRYLYGRFGARCTPRAAIASQRHGHTDTALLLRGGRP
ncbi:Ankyrin repeat domain containing protein [Pandoravirus neocaledonia]|uniref:Ankyrin repeat domain containing protein n=1 Tax=Pandoravirus neocaledonia TaxID=2107708 RepID=A0A2U7UDF3_9VIRU|nr:Ankyrin repeat domain containing protein [Pandoravirus neocaledonia]AVK76498.1 Ankyrin repeat domain containing protein [Pandoravirus neocaledonia]